MRNFFILITLTSLLIFSACEESKSNTVKSASLKDREVAILSTLSDHAFVFDYKIDQGYKALDLWVEKYEFGEIVDESLSELSTSVSEEEGMILFAKDKEIDQEGEQKYYLGASEDGGSSSTFFKVEDLKDLEEASTISGQLIENQSIEPDQEITLATIAYADHEFGVSSVPDYFYENPDEHEDVLENYALVYVFKAQFKN